MCFETNLGASEHGAENMKIVVIGKKSFLRMCAKAGLERVTLKAEK